MNWRLGLDLGTNSLGWSVLELDDEKNVISLKDMGVRIFSDGRNPKTKEPLAVERRNARGQRKIIYRRKLRRKATFRLIQSEGLYPKDKEEARKLKLLNPYELRIAALDRKLEPFELGRVLFNLSVRRGFKSNRKDGSQTEESDKNKENKTKYSQNEMCSNLEEAVNKSGYRTLGEFLWKNQKENKGIRFVSGRTIFYPTRKLYEEEFNKIKEEQIKYYPSLKWDEIYKSIFDQRPLKPQQRGKCQFMTDKDRTFKAMPCAQKLRILQEVRNLKYYDSNKKVMPISEEQEKEILNLLETKEKVTFDQIRKTLKLSDNYTFNLEENREELKGNATAVKMRSKNRFNDKWDTLSLEEQDGIVELLITAEDDEEVFASIKKYNLTEEQEYFIVKKTVLSPGTTMLCKEFSEMLVNKMTSVGAGCDYTTAVQMLGYKHSEQKIEETDKLEYYGKVLVGSTVGGDLSQPEDKPELKYGKISNPTVHVALNQTRVVVNALIKEYGKPAQIVIELARELKASRESKARLMRIQNENKKQNEIINKNLSDAYNIEYPNRTDRLKYKLWDELNAGSLGHRCIYCGKVIAGAELFTKNIEIEHILPFSRTLLDAESNLTVAHSSCNAFKKEQSPYEAFSSNPKGYNWQEILNRANQLKNPSKKNKFSESAMEMFDKESGFIARQLTDNAYLSKTARKYLSSICKDIWSVNGGMTKLLRDKWEIDSILKRKIGDKEIAHFGLKDSQIGEYKKNRYDHRHHALDAVVIGCIDRSLVKEISTLNARSQKNRIEAPQMPILRNDLIESTKKIIVSFKPDHGAQGKLSKETLLGKIKREEVVEVSRLAEKDLPLIKIEKVKNDFVSKLNEVKDFKKVIKELKDVYPQVKVFREYFVSRVAVTSFTSDKDFDSIIDSKIRTLISDFDEKNKSIKFEEIMTNFSDKYKINKIRCLNRVQTPIEILSGKTPRYLCPDDYFAAVVWEVPPVKEGGKKTYQGQFIRRDQVGKDNKPKKEVLDEFKKGLHPAAKEVGLFHKNDYLEFNENGIITLCRIAGYAATNNKFDIRPIYSTSTCEEWIISTNDYLLQSSWKPTPSQNWVSINVLFGEKKAYSIAVNPIGKIYRK